MSRESFKATPEIRKFADILMPEDAESPILNEEVQQGVYRWIVELQSERELRRVKLKPRRTCLLFGPPGTGKTTLGHHMAARLGLPLVLVRMARLTTSFFGESSKNIDRIFTEIGNQSDSCVLFLDEIDAIAGERSQDSHSERNSMVIAILQGLDNFRGTAFAATNRNDVIDAAIWRRFGIHIEIGEPDDDQRFAIIKRYLDPFQLDDKAIEILNEVMAGSSPALIRDLMENVKRQLVLAPKLSSSVPMDARGVFKSLTLTVKPHPKGLQPALWKDSYALDKLKNMAWPPVLLPEGADGDASAIAASGGGEP
jgi:SpoVK/Ycf46/Vps4 family AAA+-type ATPase